MGGRGDVSQDACGLSWRLRPGWQAISGEAGKASRRLLLFWFFQVKPRAPESPSLGWRRAVGWGEYQRAAAGELGHAALFSVPEQLALKVSAVNQVTFRRPSRELRLRTTREALLPEASRI